MVLDLTEEFRAQMVDRVVLAYIGKGTEIKMEGDRLGELPAGHKKPGKMY